MAAAAAGPIDPDSFEPSPENDLPPLNFVNCDGVSFTGS